MIYPSIDKLLIQVGSKYLLANIVNVRADEIKKTKSYQLDEYKSTSEIGMALEEIASNKIIIKDVK